MNTTKLRPKFVVDHLGQLRDFAKDRPEFTELLDEIGKIADRSIPRRPTDGPTPTVKRPDGRPKKLRYRCPTCGAAMAESRKEHICPKCGQAVYWWCEMIEWIDESEIPDDD